MTSRPSSSSNAVTPTLAIYTEWLTCAHEVGCQECVILHIYIYIYVYVYACKTKCTCMHVP